MRGNKLFNTLFTDNKEENKPATTERKGRGEDYIIQRNKLLLSRYYYYGHFTDKRFPVILNCLSREFQLAERTIQNILQTETAILKELRNNKPDLAYFKRKFPWFAW